VRIFPFRVILLVVLCSEDVLIYLQLRPFNLLSLDPELLVRVSLVLV